MQEKTTIQLPNALAHEYHEILVQISALDSRLTNFVVGLKNFVLAKSKESVQDAAEILINSLAKKIECLGKLTRGEYTLKRMLSQEDCVKQTATKSPRSNICQNLIPAQICAPETRIETPAAKPTNRNSMTDAINEFKGAKFKPGVSMNKSCTTQSTNASPEREAKTEQKSNARTVTEMAEELRSRTLSAKPNHFDTILKLYKLNFIDKEQSGLLKKRIVAKDDRVTQALVDFGKKKDLQVLITDLADVLSLA